MHALQQFERRRRGNGQDAVRAGDCSAANIQRRTDELIDAERLGADRRADDIHDRVGRADFVEVNVLDVDVVDLGFRRAQREKDFARPCCFARFADAERRRR